MRFKFYVLISLIIHLIIITLANTNTRKERLKGEKITPIEIINNKSFNSSKGNTNKNSSKISPSNNAERKKKLTKKDTEIKNSKDLNLKNKNKNIKGDFQINKREINKKPEVKEDNRVPIKGKQVNKKIKKKRENNSLIKEQKLDTNISNPLTKGISNNDSKNDIEKGSIKGRGRLKITCLNCISPKYPRKALKKGLEGKTIVKVWILKSGEVEKAEIIISSGIISFDKAALEAAQESKFYPIEFDSFLNIQYDLVLN